MVTIGRALNEDIVILVLDYVEAPKTTGGASWAEVVDALMSFEITSKEIADEQARRDDEAMEIFLSELRAWMDEKHGSTPEEIANWIRVYLDKCEAL